MDAFVGFVVLAILAVLYFLPSVIANNREHHNTAAICVVNFFFGWTFLGWVISLAWAFTKVNNN